MRNRILFISYDFHPHKGVSAFRNSYWAQNIREASGNTRESLVVTANPDAVKNSGNATIEKIFYVPISKKRPPMSYFIKDNGLLWKKNLQTFIKSNKALMPSVVVITGSPFLHFSVAKDVKKIWGSKVILDFRDPFANNPSFDISKGKDFIKRRIENYYVSLADKILVINQMCKDLLKQDKTILDKTQIIANGFNETILTKVPIHKTNNSKFTLIYPGRVLKTYELQNTLDALLDPALVNSVVLSFVGKKDDAFDNLSIPPNFKFEGEKSNLDTLADIQQADAGIILRGKNLFSSTTKIYDYIALNKPILLISDENEKVGPVSEILKDYPIILHVKNNSESISKGIFQLMNSDLKFDYPNKMNFSRKHSLDKLLQTINSL